MRRRAKSTVLEPHEGTKVIRPITDSEWNRRQMNTRVRMSKKQRLAERKRIREAMSNKGVTA